MLIERALEAEPAAAQMAVVLPARVHGAVHGQRAGQLEALAARRARVRPLARVLALVVAQEALLLRTRNHTPLYHLYTILTKVDPL